MTTYQPGDVVLVAFPYTAGGQTKDRPGLVLLDTGDADVVLARITTQAPHAACDVTLNDWQTSGLLVPSIVRLHKIATVEKIQIRRVLGMLQPTDRQLVAAVLAQLFGNW